MIPEILNSFSLNLDHLHRLLEGIPEHRLVEQPEAQHNHPIWTLGHLAYSLEAMAGELAIEPWLPKPWTRIFGPGSKPVQNGDAYPVRDELLEAIEEGRRRLTEALSSLDEEDLLQPLPDARHRRRYPTIGHALLHILAAHLAVHVGQLGAWRRAAGLPPVLEHDGTPNE